MAGIFTQETMNNLAGPQLLEPLSLLRPGEKIARENFPTRYQPTAPPAAFVRTGEPTRCDLRTYPARRFCFRTSRHEDCVLWLIQIVVVFDAL
jgi:hypothetical protein